MRNQQQQQLSRRAASILTKTAATTNTNTTNYNLVQPVEFHHSWNHPHQTPTTSSHSRWFSSTTTDKKGEDTSTTTETTDEATAKEAAEEEEEASQTNKEEELQAEIKALKDQLLRSYAEQENTRNIAKRDVSEARQFAIKSFAKSLLDVSDNLQRALDSVDPEHVESNAQLKSLFEGIEMTNGGLIKALASNGVVKYCETPGEKFDPSLHNALMQYPDPEKDSDTVGQVIKVGFTLNDRVLRPAEVGVVKNP